MSGHKKKIIEKGIIEYPGIGMRVYPLGWVRWLGG